MARNGERRTIAGMSLEIVPMYLTDASLFVELHHRHHPPPQGGLFAVGAASRNQVIGAAIVGRPVSRLLQDGWTAEVTRLCVLDGYPNACSMLYAACWRAARALGWRRLITYTLPVEGSSSLRGAGWRLVGERGGGTWNRDGRPRVDRHPAGQKLLWERSTGVTEAAE